MTKYHKSIFRPRNERCPLVQSYWHFDGDIPSARLFPNGKSAPGLLLGLAGFGASARPDSESLVNKNEQSQHSNWPQASPWQSTWQRAPSSSSSSIWMVVWWMENNAKTSFWT